MCSVWSLVGLKMMNLCFCLWGMWVECFLLWVVNVVLLVGVIWFLVCSLVMWVMLIVF